MPHKAKPIELGDTLIDKSGLPPVPNDRTDGDTRSKIEKRSRRTRVRLSPDQRERMILEGAMQFFAERGFAADTRDLARGLGVSQSLIYRYFSSKQDLLERVYEQTFVSRWKKEWEPLLKNRTLPLEERLRRFYLDYFSVVDDKIWIRIALRSSLAGHRLTRRYIKTYIDQLLEIIAQEIRIARGIKNTNPLSPLELELVWHLHSTLIYFLIRKYIHGVTVGNDIPAIVDTVIDNFMYGIEKRPPKKR